MNIEIVPSIGILVFKGGDVLVVKHGEAAGHVTGVYGIPSGKLEGRSEKEVAVKELEEETGLQTKEEDLLEFPDNHFSADISRKDGTIKRFPWTVFICTKYSGELRGTEETIPEWVAISKLNTLESLLPNVIEAAKNGLSFFQSHPEFISGS
ncbi:hypothetical protein A3F00_04375 [Candidatus Daviesbacteria bacterium RIFCSPHIGHO2_12_FULL_37_11]|uniref:Nudix hydrolase domain-containing protein n=1 Tax=Candidatus Daviesbacteria bacterium RIFCSPHIGHO2_12_FULL_37_11 TaxID=1797777 RepID=A0A1F5K9T4_9BACT|nr:MAG: hypothetical protein UT01_C0070G0003 [Candidatus Daviesbacteria bacterium GW2011_GWA1_38_7]OGE16136.1 MAG: hypothetical protein A2769_03545 [Candidatus Daviesbacteria bacterium RIFCSPHIGHO2_01_FULL_37_27]OGE37659.1 MAG: hypothetical protein A3F00_04375 [Candidatus Daviesbacteria bacterium RIFCSPHIGHO2_12_FULL_37_11]OGE45416.1 MAG: hypothetical protein A3B39_04775 [Candidatus Daviesbacteria bacterium RIFCSPLOWO2_01_FULL_37_10]